MLDIVHARPQTTGMGIFKQRKMDTMGKVYSISINSVKETLKNLFDNYESMVR